MHVIVVVGAPIRCSLSAHFWPLLVLKAFVNFLLLLETPALRNRNFLSFAFNWIFNLFHFNWLWKIKGLTFPLVLNAYWFTYLSPFEVGSSLLFMNYLAPQLIRFRFSVSSNLSPIHDYFLVAIHPGTFIFIYFFFVFFISPCPFEFFATCAQLITDADRTHICRFDCI